MKVTKFVIDSSKVLATIPDRNPIKCIEFSHDEPAEPSEEIYDTT